VTADNKIVLFIDRRHIYLQIELVASLLTAEKEYMIIIDLPYSLLNSSHTLSRRAVVNFAVIVSSVHIHSANIRFK